MFKKIIKKFLPKSFLLFYHKVLAVLAAFFYGWPSRKMIVIGVTGTAGKSTVVNLIGRILEEAGFKIGWTTTMNFKIAEKEWLNKTKMTMLGRFALQKFLKKMVQAGCQYAIIETSSEGILQSRHLGIEYDLAVFTCLHPEHIEAHGGFENYKKTKGKLFAGLTKKRRKIINGQKIKKTIIVNLDDENATYFLSFKADEYYGYHLKSQISSLKIANQNLKIIQAENIKSDTNGSKFTIQDSEFQIHLLGEFNIYNALAAVSVGLSQGVSLEIAKRALGKIKTLPGRMEIVIDRPFKVIVDYAHTPKELENVYQLISSKLKIKNSKLICVLGSAGGGRDKWKRPVLGKTAAKYCDEIILTNEDPYDENPATIIDEIEAGFSQIPNSKFQIPKYEKILDRKEAIRKALSLAKENDIVIITGKGCEPWLCLARGKKIPWDDRQIVKEECQKLSTD
ncbi:MAG: UDP-N-acetylmuramoyl-L-alanyl-D-glutamate--2,6-diaminopimelate ligase [Patescibacteria group bacterium]|nr:UDP-N-acetylmuramoyl-L-alanyl-D-glutamate--2,6-diaminopimelate ligase [Patescibacteria group bacterium]